MRGNRLAVIVLACAAGCHSSQPGSAWNNGWDSDAPPPLGSYDSVDAGDTDVADAGWAGNYSGPGSATNPLNPCDSTTQQAALSLMVSQPIVVNGAGGLDMAGAGADGGVAWTGLTVQQAVTQLCQASNANGYFSPGSSDDAWGEGNVLVADYDPTTWLIDALAVNPGYQGALAATDPDCTVADVCGFVGTPCTVTWTVSLTGQITKQVAANALPANAAPPYPTASAAAQRVVFAWDGGQLDRDQWSSFYNGLVFTFGHTLVSAGFPPSALTCFATGQCVTDASGSSPSFAAPSFGLTIVFGSLTGTQPVPSVPQQIRLSMAKLMPYSFADVNLALDAVGPAAPGAAPEPAPNCTLELGLFYNPSADGGASFLSNCVFVDATSGDNALEQAKLIEGSSHDDQTYGLRSPGLSVDFFAAGLPPTQVLEDGAQPQANDYSGHLRVGEATYGAILNDQSPGGLDLHGTGAVYLEYKRLVITTLRALAGFKPGTSNDAECTFQPGSPPPNTATWEAALPGYCTGFEGIITPAPPSSPTDFGNIGDANWNSVVGTSLAAFPPFGIQGMKPGAPAAYFCFDPGGVGNAENLVFDEFPSIAASLSMTGAPNIPYSGFTDCYPSPNATGNPADGQPSLFAASAARVTAVMGHGNVANLPLAAQDQGFFFEQYGISLLQYLMATDQTGSPLAGSTCEGTGTSTCTDGLSCVEGLCTVPVEYNDLVFSTSADGQEVTLKYVDRRFADTTGAPLAFVMTWNIPDGIVKSYDFYRELYRGESLIYATTRQSSSDVLGAESTALLTNIFGSPVLQNALLSNPATGLPYWQDTTDPNSGAVVHTAYDCATQNLTAAVNPNDTAPCLNPPPLNSAGGLLLNADGQPILEPYMPVLSNTFSPSVLALGESRLQLVGTQPGTTDATVQVPLRGNPWDATTACPGGTGCPAEGSTLGPFTVSGGAIQGLVPSLPAQPGAGFTVPSSSGTDAFVEAASLELSGATLNAQVFYDSYSTGTCKLAQTSCSSDADCKKEGDSCVATEDLNLLAASSSDFLGDVFLCQDQATGSLLSARMYTPVNTLMSWLEQHPNAYGTCGIVVGYGPLGASVASITSTVNGVTVQASSNRVVGATLFVPGQ